MKKPQTAKAKAASKKNIETWEKKQALMNRISDNKEVLTIGFFLGAIPMFLIALIVLGL